MTSAAEELSLCSADAFWEYLEGLCVHEKRVHPTLGNAQDLIVLMLKKR